MHTMRTLSASQRNAALHNTHGPIEAPLEYEAFYTYSDNKRNTFDAMVSVVDRTVKNVTDALQASNMWDNCLFVWTTDNGSPCQVAGKLADISSFCGRTIGRQTTLIVLRR